MFLGSITYFGEGLFIAGGAGVTPFICILRNLHSHGFIGEEFLKANIDDFAQQFYVCGPLPMIDAVTKQLANLGVSEKAITIEKI